MKLDQYMPDTEMNMNCNNKDKQQWQVTYSFIVPCGVIHVMVDMFDLGKFCVNYMTSLCCAELK